MAFTYYYPLMMSMAWTIGGMVYFVRWERPQGSGEISPPKLKSYPLVTFVVPSHNEEAVIHETLSHLAKQRYPNYEIIVINDGSTDRTARVVAGFSRKMSNLRVIHFLRNQGKAMGLRTAAMVSDGEYLICIDGDALLDPDAAFWMVRHFQSSPRVGAVTGNPRVRTRSTLLGRVQVGEFSSIIGLIKRAQRIYGRIFSVSGVVAAFRRSALHRVGYWSVDMITEDIDITWKLQLDHWEIRFEPRALCWILMPETLKGLWRQRLRWAQGGMEVIMKYTRQVIRWRNRRMWPIYLEFCVTALWVYALIGLLLAWSAIHLFASPESVVLERLIPTTHGILLIAACLLQFGVAMMIDRRYEKGLGRFYYWMIWYPLAYGLVIIATTAVAIPKAALRKRGRRAIWTSPDRGLRQ